MLARDSLREDGAARRWSAAVLAACTLLGAAARLASLRALPVFGDEALNLRLAVLARKDLVARLWISLQEAQPPLHVWLLALVLPVSPDPVLAGRLLSAAAGILSIPAAAWAARRVFDAFAPGISRSESRSVSAATAVLVAVSPFFVFAERLARVDALFLLESALAAGMSVELACRAGSGRGGRLPLGAAYGILLGATMLTRQAVSYPLWLLAPGAWVLLPAERRAEPGSGRRLLAALALAAVVAAALWIPMLAAPGASATMTRIFHSADYRPDMGLGARLGLLISNLRLAGEAFALYLPPPVLFLAAVGAVGLLPRRRARRRLLAFLLIWGAILLAPTAVFAASYFPRYALPAALPVCVFAALEVASLWEQVLRRLRRPAVRGALTLVVAVFVIGWSLRDLGLGLRSWRDWPLLPIDRAQFVSGPSAGFASEAAAGWLRAKAVERPLTVLTPEIAGNPTDGVWLLLEDDPRIHLSYAPDALGRPLLPPVQPDGTRLLAGDSRDPLRRPFALLENAPVFAVVPDPLLTRSGWVAAVPFLARLNPGSSEAARFENPAGPGPGPGCPVNAVVVLRLGTP